MVRPTCTKSQSARSITAAIPAACVLEWRQAPRQLRKPLVIILDQFEEYFAYRSGDRDLEKQLDTIVRDKSLDARLMIVLREDRYYLLDRLRLTIPDILENTLELGHLGDKAVREAITRPIDEFNARIRGGKNPVAITPGFVDRVLAELRQVETGGPPIFGAILSPGVIQPLRELRPPPFRSRPLHRDRQRLLLTDDDHQPLAAGDRRVE